MEGQDFHLEEPVQVTLEWRGPAGQTVRYPKTITAQQLSELLGAVDELEECVREEPITIERGSYG